MKLLDLGQNTVAWTEWREKGLGASDAPIVMGVSPWTQPYELWLIKTKKMAIPKANEAMKRGSLLEPVARQEYIKVTGIKMGPLCGERDELSFLRCSFDGINFEKGIILEIKCPNWVDHHGALKGEVPKKYVYQLQHQLYVSGLDMLHYVSYSPQQNSMALVEVKRDEDLIERLVTKCTEFWSKVLSNKWE